MRQITYISLWTFLSSNTLTKYVPSASTPPPPTCMHAKKKWQTANLDTEGAIYFTSAIYNQDKAFKPLRLRPISLLQVQLKKYLRTVSKSMEINFLKCLK